MKNIIKIIKEKDLDILLIMALLVSGAAFLVFLNIGDELWNFANCYKMFNGYKIYKDLNVIITPLFFYIAQIFFELFGATLLAFRIYNALIFISFFMLIYSIFKNLNIVRRRAILYIILLLVIFNGMIAGGANYNIQVMIPILINILLIIKNKENNMVSGVLLFATFLIKQNVFVYFAIAIFIYKFITKKDIKEFASNLIKIYATTLVGIIAFFIYLYIDNNLYNFINYCFLGILEFGGENKGIDFYSARYTYISIGATAFILFIINNKKINKNLNNEIINKAKILLSFGIPMLLIQYPIANYYHSVLAALIIIITLIYIIEKILLQELDINAKKENILYTVLCIIYLLYYICAIVSSIKMINKGQADLLKKGPYYGSVALREDLESMERICNYIKEQEKNNVNVKVLSYKANLYMIQLNKNNEIFDMAFLGNLGVGGEKELINRIKDLNKTLILIETDSDQMFYQESKKVRQYIINNYKKVGEIEEYSVFYIE